jgi:hypothetical protein
VSVSTLTRPQLIECLRKQPILEIQALPSSIKTLPSEDIQIVRRLMNEILPVRSWHEFATLKQVTPDAREVVFREMVVRAIEATLDLLLEAADESLLRRLTRALQAADSSFLTPEEKNQLVARLNDAMKELSWNTDTMAAVRREYAAFLNKLRPARRLKIIRDALAGDMLDGLVSEYFGGSGPHLKLAEAIADPEDVVARLTRWGLARIQEELAKRTENEDLHPAVGCGLQLAFAVLSKCVGDGSCTTNQISEIFREPHAHFQAATEGAQALCWDTRRFIDLSEAWPDLDIFASKVVTVFFPGPGATGTEMATAAADVFFDVAMRLACRGPTDRCPDAKAARKLQTLHDIVHAMLQHDVGTVLVGTSHLAEQYFLEDGQSDDATKTKEALHKATEFIGAIAAYASTFDTKASDAEALAAAREARKRAIESLIDTATDRRGRHGDKVLSIGANVGFSMWGQQRLYDDESDGYADWESQWLRLQLPMGIALQYVPDESRWTGWRRKFCRRMGCGIHAQISLVDLGQFLADSEGKFNEVTPRDFVAVGGQFGLILGSPSMPFVIGADMHWASSLFPRTCTGDNCGDAEGETRSGALQWGFFASYYVPFFDLN